MTYLKPLCNEKLNHIVSQHDRKTRQSFKMVKFMFDHGMKFHHKKLLNKMDSIDLRFKDRVIKLSSFSDEEKVVFLNIGARYLKLDIVRKEFVLLRKLHLAYWKENFYYLHEAVKSTTTVQIAGEDGKWIRFTTLCPLDVSIANPSLMNARYLRRYHGNS